MFVVEDRGYPSGPGEGQPPAGSVTLLEDKDGDGHNAIVPGQPDASILVFRMESTEPEIRMPELGRAFVQAYSAACDA